MKRARAKQAKVIVFSEFMTQPHVSAALVTFALLALVLSIIEFTGVISY